MADLDLLFGAVGVTLARRDATTAAFSIARSGRSLARMLKMFKLVRLVDNRQLLTAVTYYTCVFCCRRKPSENLAPTNR